MEALLVIDMDGADDWKNLSRFSLKDRDMRKFAVKIRKMIDVKRAEGKLIIFITMPHEQCMGQESQISIVKPPEQDSERVLKNTSVNVYQLMMEEKCIGCCASGGLAEFLGHRHGEIFEPVFLKINYDGFTNNALINYCRDNGIDSVILSGCYTFACVLGTALGALRNGINVKLDARHVYPQMNSRDVKAWMGFVEENIRSSPENNASNLLSRITII